MYLNTERKESAAQLLAAQALRQAVYGDCEHAKSNAAEAMKFSRGRIEIGTASMAFGFCNATAQSQALIDEATKAYPKDTGVSVIGVPLSRAVLELSRGNGAAAVQNLEATRRYDLGEMVRLWNNYVRALGYLQQRDAAAAVAEFQVIINHREIDIASPLYGLAHLGLARAFVLKGDVGQARKEYQDLFAFWKDADADLPVLIQARKEYEQLK